MSTSREKMQQARDLIQQKRYDEARTILRTVNHDTALDWLDKIDKLDPPKSKRKQRPMLAFLLLMLAICILVIGIVYYNSVIGPANDNLSQAVRQIDAKYAAESTLAHTRP